ncbi:RNA-directed DNA polymerase from mobile element jockey-like [Elysia marginata]|uniref:RNA-directed DNA polymerase from mobile element jockey-like n=1 Tax=Elysia marginata TaxID=1093978 RepID=A0AAV4EUU4_9GAST|nr:RNA-directed DNA polymerase from mobile element jockey-like [Elysia marginata]
MTVVVGILAYAPYIGVSVYPAKHVKRVHLCLTGAKSGILINGVNINNIRYADDAVVLTESEKQLQAMLDRIVDKCKEYGMKINARKTKTMHIGRDTKTLKITVGNAVLEQVSKYSYLEDMIMEDVVTLKEVQIRIEKTRQKFWENIELLRKNVFLNTKKRILACYVF